MQRSKAQTNRPSALRTRWFPHRRTFTHSAIAGRKAGHHVGGLSSNGLDTRLHRHTRPQMRRRP